MARMVRAATSRNATTATAPTSSAISATASNNPRRASAPEGSVIYGLRRGYSLLLAREGVDDRDAVKRMGHSTTMHAQHYDGSIEALREQPREPIEAVVLKARAA